MIKKKNLKHKRKAIHVWEKNKDRISTSNSHLTSYQKPWRRECSGVIHSECVKKDKKLSTENSKPVKIFFKNEGEIKTFAGKKGEDSFPAGMPSPNH